MATGKQISPIFINVVKDEAGQSDSLLCLRKSWSMPFETHFITQHRTEESCLEESEQVNQG